MGTIFRTVKGEFLSEAEGPSRMTTTALYPGIGRCTVCAEPEARGYWMSRGGTLELCLGCALDALPKLLADVLVGEFDRPNAVQQLQTGLAQFREVFWRAACIALTRVSKAAKPYQNAEALEAHRNGHAGRNGAA